MGSIPRSGRSPQEGNGSPLQYSCLGNPIDRGACSPWGHKESDTTHWVKLGPENQNQDQNRNIHKHERGISRMAFMSSALYQLIVPLSLLTTVPRGIQEEVYWGCVQMAYSLVRVHILYFIASLVAQLVKNLPTVQETWVLSLNWEDPLEMGKATHSSILAWRIPGTMYSPRSPKEWDTTEGLSFTFNL